MDVTMLKEFNTVERYVETVRQNADNNKKSFGFLPAPSYRLSAYQGKLWVACSAENGEYAGHIMFGGRYPTLKVFQLFVSRQYRKQKIGHKLISELIRFGEEHNYRSIIAKVAADLPANQFWESEGLFLARQEKGGGTLNRIINIRVMELDTPSLFDSLSDSNLAGAASNVDSITYSDSPIYGNPTYILDVNVLLDVVKHRPRFEQAAKVIKSSLSSQIKLCVTSEFLHELETDSAIYKIDPVLAVANSLPVLPDVSHEILEPLISELTILVFPQREVLEKLTPNEHSDLIHLASAIHHQVHGFITSDEALLRQSGEIRDRYQLEVISPYDLVTDEEEASDTGVSAFYNGERIQISQGQEAERLEIERYLGGLGATTSQISSIWAPGTDISPRQRFSIKADDKLIGVAAWNSPATTLESTGLKLFIDEKHPAALKVIDHILEKVQLETPLKIVRRVELELLAGQDLTKQAALERGFRKLAIDSTSTNPHTISKICWRGPLSSDEWTEFKECLETITGVVIPPVIPTYDEFTNTGILVKHGSTGKQALLKLFEFETLFSPVIVLCKSRPGILLPIRKEYSKELFGDDNQLSLLPSQEALLHIEKAYFKRPRNVKLTKKGLPVIFYESSPHGGRKALIGSGRITFSDVLTVDNAVIRLSRQGVLTREKLVNISGSNECVHAITFDNFSKFSNLIPFSELKENGYVSGANLITAEKITFQQMCTILTKAHSK